MAKKRKRTEEEEKRERLRRIAQARAGIEEKDDALDMENEAAGEPDSGHSGGTEPPGEWEALSEQENAIENGAFGTGNEEPVNTMSAGESTPGEAQMQTGMDTAQDGEDDEPEEEPPQTDEPEANEGGETPEKTEGTENTEEPETEKAKTESGYTYKGKTYGRGELDLSDDPVAAVEVMHSGGMSALSDATIRAMNEWAEESDGVKAVLGILTDENMQEYAEVEEDGSLTEKNYRNAHSIFIENCGVLGTTLSKFAMKLNDPSFPPELYADAVGTLLTIVTEAEKSGYTGDGNMYDAYCEGKKESPEIAALVNSFGQYRELFTEKNGLDEVMDEAVHQAQLRCQAGEGTAEDFELLYAQVPEMPQKKKNQDVTYSGYWNQFMGEREDSERYDTENNWYMDRAKEYMQANHMGTDMYGPEAMAAKDKLHDSRIEALDMLMDHAVKTGYTDFGKFMSDHGFDEETINELALHNLRVYDKTIDTPENAELVNEMIADGNEGGNTHEKGDILTGINAFARGWMAGTAGYLAEGFEAYYTWVQSTDISTDSARLRNQYAAQYGIFGGEKELYDELMQMCEEEFFPSEGMNKFVKSYLEEGGNPYLLGIEPGKLGWVAQAANDIKDVQEVHEEWKENQSEGIQDVFNTGSWLGEHVTSALFDKKWISPALGFMGKYADAATALITSGAGWYNAGHQKGMEDGYSHGQSQKLGLGYIAGAWAGSSENMISSKANAVYSETVKQLSMTKLGRWCTGFVQNHIKLSEEERKKASSIISGAMEEPKMYIDDRKGEIGGAIADGGVRLFLNSPNQRAEPLPSEELLKTIGLYFY